MARAPVTRGLQRRLRVAALTIGLLTAPGVAYATYPVIDMSGLQQAVQQLSALKEQIALVTQQIEQMTQLLSFVNDISKAAQDTIEAIGAVGEITLPFVNLVKMTNRLKGDAMCLMPNLMDALPSLNWDDIDLSSICSARSGYAKNLWFDPEEAKDMSWEEQEEMRREVKKRREALTQVAAIDGLAHADVMLDSGVDDALQATKELENNAKAAKDMNDRLAVIAQGQVVISQQLSVQNQLLASLLKVQSAAAMNSTIDQRPPEDDGEKSE